MHSVGNAQTFLCELTMHHTLTQVFPNINHRTFLLYHVHGSMHQIPVMSTNELYHFHLPSTSLLRGYVVFFPYSLFHLFWVSPTLWMCLSDNLGSFNVNPTSKATCFSDLEGVEATYVKSTCFAFFLFTQPKHQSLLIAPNGHLANLSSLKKSPIRGTCVLPAWTVCGPLFTQL